MGIVNPDSRFEKYRDYCEQGAITGMLRGTDSTGMFQVNKKGGFDTYKMGVSGDMFMANKGAQKRLNKISNLTIATIIHNRAATRGDVSDDNAHPFIHVKDGPKGKPAHGLVGVHNGTLWSTHPAKEDGRDFEVDSDYLFYQICKLGAVEALKEVSGSYALVWYENNWGLKIAVNEERPLYWGFVRDRNAMLIASEAGMMCWLAERNGIAIEQGGIVAPEKNKIYTFDLRGELRAFTTEEVPEKWQNNSRNFHHGYQSVADRTVVSTDSSSSTKTLQQLGLFLNDTAPFTLLGNLSESQRDIDGMIELPNGDPINARMYNVSPAIIRHLRDCEFANVQVRSTMRYNQQDFVIVGHPVEVVSTDDKKKEAVVVRQADEFAELDDLEQQEHVVPEGMIKGPKGKPVTGKTFQKLTENGCINCGKDCLPQDADKMQWVNVSGVDPLCVKCVQEMEERSAARKGAVA